MSPPSKVSLMRNDSEFHQSLISLIVASNLRQSIKDLLLENA